MTEPDATAISEVEFWKNVNDSNKALLLQAADRMEEMEVEIERLRAVVRTAQESLHQAMERIRFMEATKRSVNPVAKSYLEQAERVLAEVLGDE